MVSYGHMAAIKVANGDVTDARSMHSRVNNPPICCRGCNHSGGGGDGQRYCWYRLPPTAIRRVHVKR